MRYVLGVDGGGTKTEALVMDENGLLRGSAIGGPTSLDKTSRDSLVEHLGSTIGLAVERSRIAASDLTRLYLGMAGVTSETSAEFVRRLVMERLNAAEHVILVDHDLRSALSGALLGRSGVVLIAGTGSSCYGEHLGRSWKSGGYGPLISDDCSGYWLGLQTIRAAAMVDDGRLPHRPALQQLRDRTFGRLRIAACEDLIELLHVQGLSASEVGELAPLLIDAAHEGDEYALAVLASGVDQLTAYASAVVAELGLAGSAFDVGLVGGVFSGNRVLEESVVAKVTHRFPLCSVTPGAASPAVGACLLALKSIGVSLTGRQLDALRTPVTPNI